MQSTPSLHPRIFLSYSHEDVEFARRLQHDLEAEGAAVRDTAGPEREAAGAEVLKQYDHVIIILTPIAIASGRVQAEAYTALAVQREGQGSLRDTLLFVAQPVDPAAIPPTWAPLDRIDATQDYQTALAWLLVRLGLGAAQSTVTVIERVAGSLNFGSGDISLGGVSPDVAPDIAPPPLAKEEEPASEAVHAPPPPTANEEHTLAAPPVPPAPAWDANEIVRGWDDTPTILAPGRQETPSPAPAAEPPAPPPAPAPSAAPAPSTATPETPDVLRGGGSWLPSASPPPVAAGEPDRAPAPGFGPPPPPPAQGYPGYPPAPAPAPAPAPSYPPAPGAASPYPYAPPPAYGAPPNPMAPAPQGGYGYPGPFASWPAAPASPVAVAEQVMFTAYHVREIAPQAWEPLYVYIALDTPQAQVQVQAAAQQVLAGRMSEFRPATAAETSWLRRGAQLTFVPSVPGCVFNPPEQTVAWYADVQQLAFGMQAVTAPPGFAVNGSIQVFTGPLLRADIPISVFVRQPGMYAPAQQQRTFATTVARAYRKVFASYSHRDTAVVQSCETAAQVTGDRYLRDVTLLRSGEQWNDRLLQAIGEADLFQLFWSENAARSPAVQTEWRHALALQPARGSFIRPVYWSRQLYAIPPELQAIHFERLSLTRLGWGKLRIFLHDALGLS